jgi:superfamily II DNA or RNA helicase
MGQFLTSKYFYYNDIIIMSQLIKTGRFYPGIVSSRNPERNRGIYDVSKNIPKGIVADGKTERFFQLSDFIPGYPSYNEYVDDMYNIYDDSVQHVNYLKKEFNMNKLDENESLPRSGELLKNQKFLSKFLSAETLNDELLVFHAVGTGKTITSIAIAETNQEPTGARMNSKYQKTLVIVKGDTIARNFINQLSTVYSKTKYLPDNYELLTEGEKVRRVNSLVGKNYEFKTFITFAKELATMSNELIRRVYSNRTIIVDEVHNLRIQDKADRSLKVYENIHRFLHSIENRKIVLLSATPAKNKAYELSSVMNLILPLSEQMPTDSEFERMFFNKEKRLINSEQLKSHLRGRVSYLRGMESNVVKTYKGSVVGSMKKINIVTSDMSKFQTDNYNKYYSSDIGSSEELDELGDVVEEEEDDDEESKRGFYDKSRQASLFIFPDGSTGKEGFEKYLVETKGGTNRGWKLGKELYNILTDNGKATQFQIIENISKYGSKYADTLREILLHPTEKAFVYGKYVKGSGGILFGELLRILDFDHMRASSGKPKGIPSYVIVTKKTVSEFEIDNILEIFNTKDNIYGKNLRVIVGSQIIGEGKTLKALRQIHILTPHWNNSETIQAIGRGDRAFAHDDLPVEERYMKIFRWCAIPKGKIKSIDFEFYKMSEDKDLEIKQVERVCKIIAVDCQLNKSRNLLSMDKDYTVSCQYDKCEYTCDGMEDMEFVEGSELITDTYNLFYGEEETRALMTVIKQLFKEKFTYNLEELLHNFSDMPHMIVIKTLKNMIDLSVEVKNRYGFSSYIREERDFYFLVDKVSLPSSFSLAYYSRHPKLSSGIDFQTITKISQYNYLEDKIKIMTLTAEKDKDVIRQIETFSNEIKEMFIEQAYLNPESRIGKLVVAHFRNFIVKFADTAKVKVISTLLEDEDKLRCFNGEEWKDCDTSTVKEIDKIKEVVKENLEENKYYGIILTNKKDTKGENIFKIKKVNKAELLAEAESKMKKKGAKGAKGDKVAKIDKRDVNRGIVCKTVVPVHRIVQVALDLKIVPEKKVSYDRKTATKQLLDLIQTGIDKKVSEITVYTKKQLDEMSEDEFHTIFYWYTSTKTQLCDSIKNYFDAKGLLLYEKE